MKSIIVSFLILSLSPSLFSKDFKKIESIINTILEESPSSRKSIVDSADKKRTVKKETVKDDEAESDKDKGKKSITMAQPDEILLKTAIQLYNSSLYTRAENKFSALVKEYPESPFLDSARFWTGKIKVKKYRYDEAIKEFKAIKKDSGEYPNALFNIGFCNFLKGNGIGSITFFQKLSSQFPEHELADNALLMTAKVFFNNKKGSQALESTVKLIKEYSKRETVDDAYYLLGKIYEKDPLLKDPESARKIYKLFLKKAHSGDPAYRNSPLKPKVMEDLKYINHTYFMIEN